MLLHYFLTNELKLEDLQKELNKIIIKHNKKNKKNKIHVNTYIFFNQLSQILNNIKKLKYKNNCLLMLEGENSYFEDINLFEKNSQKSKISFIQVKGSMANNSIGSLDNAIISTIAKFIKNPNRELESELILMINKSSSSYLKLNSDSDKKEAIIKILRNLKVIPYSRSKAKYEGLFRIIDDYIDNKYFNKNDITIADYYVKQTNISLYNFYKDIFNELNLMKLINEINKTLKKTKVIENLDHRLIYVILVNYYGKNKFHKILWNIEMKCIDAKKTNISLYINYLTNINFDKNTIFKIKFTENKKVSIGKIL